MSSSLPRAASVRRQSTRRSVSSMSAWTFVPSAPPAPPRHTTSAAMSESLTSTRSGAPARQGVLVRKAHVRVRGARAAVCAATAAWAAQASVSLRLSLFQASRLDAVGRYRVVLDQVRCRYTQRVRNPLWAHWRDQYPRAASPASEHGAQPTKAGARAHLPPGQGAKKWVGKISNGFS